MILCNYCGGLVNDRMVCRECGTPAGVGYAPAGAGTQAVPAPAATPVTARKGGGMKLAVAALILAAIGGLAWWGVTARERALAELRQRELIEAQGPLAVESITLQNTTYNGDPLGAPTTRFARKDIRYIAFKATLRNNAAGLNGVSGKLGVKYVAPTEEIAGAGSGSSGYTFELPFSLRRDEETRVVPSSWGSEAGGSFKRSGTWRVELWFNGRKIGEAPFTVN